ncbi:unnamed protein product [Ranitomeya imitator]|uniref:Ig-like domain-containing protein n=1 Tax=Ranitomeya imitator TaxID=111125 RepID=A0ABN9MLN3_9NEOB|nr:unnamed protein product [Ranitomeya imitator]
MTKSSMHTIRPMPTTLPPNERTQKATDTYTQTPNKYKNGAMRVYLIMIVIIILLVAAIALIIGLSVAGNSSANDVTTVNAVGQISGNVLLSCTFAPDVKQSSDVLWEKVGDTGVVYKYENGKISLSDQNSKYKSRTSLFLNELSVGNATLMISGLTVADSGVYKCTITNSNGKGDNKLSLNVGVSTPGQSEDSNCPEEKRGWNPELQKNGETKVAELARLLRANSANGKKDTQSS